MSVYLTIDQGNTSAKLALWAADGTLLRTEARMRFTVRDVATFAGDMDICGAIYCTVSGRSGAMLRALERRCGHVIDFNIDTPMPLVVDYKSPHTLGLDRVAAAVGAFCKPGYEGRELLVVDIGTAITYDRVAADGHFTGGNIAPGINMRLRALNHYTARLPLVDAVKWRGDVPRWGTTTVEALYAGAVRGVVGELTYYRGLLGADAGVVLTGGGSDTVARLVDFDVTVEHDLVSRGLYEILRYNAVGIR